MFNSDLDIDIPKFLIVNTRDPGLRTAFYEKEHGIMWNAWNGSGAGRLGRVTLAATSSLSHGTLPFISMPPLGLAIVCGK